MHYYEYHNHKWAKNLKHARKLLAEEKYKTFYRGEDFADGDIYPGMRVMAAYWVSVEHEMPLRCRSLLKGSAHPEWENDPELVQQNDLFLARYLDDMRELVARDNVVPLAQFDAMVKRGLDLPADWSEQMRAWQAQTESAITEGKPISKELSDAWFDSCLRSVANYNRFLIQGGVIASAIVKRGGTSALHTAVDHTAEDFMWEVSREFYARALPAAGFEDIGDLTELGMRGMYSDQYYTSGAERPDGEGSIRTSTLHNCELAGIFWRVAEWNNMPKTAIGYGICRYCERHGEATMMIVVPPMSTPIYRRVQSLGIDNKECVYELRLQPADDMPRILMVQEKVFGTVE